MATTTYYYYYLISISSRLALDSCSLRCSQSVGRPLLQQFSIAASTTVMSAAAAVLWADARALFCARDCSADVPWKRI